MTIMHYKIGTLNSMGNLIKLESPQIWKNTDFWLITTGALCSCVLIFFLSSLIERTITIAAILLSFAGGIKAVWASTPTVGYFRPDDWIQSNDIAKLVITSKDHKKGKCPSFKLFEEDGSEFIAGEQIVDLAGNIELQVPSDNIPRGKIVIR
jgi:hypothetical protein